MHRQIYYYFVIIKILGILRNYFPNAFTQLKKHTRRRTLIVLYSVSFVFAYTTMLRRVDTGIRFLYGHDGEFQPNLHEMASIQNWDFQVRQETTFETRYFIEKFDRNNKVSMVDTGHIAALDEEQVIPLIDEILK